MWLKQISSVARSKQHINAALIMLWFNQQLYTCNTEKQLKLFPDIYQKYYKYEIKHARWNDIIKATQ